MSTRLAPYLTWSGKRRLQHLRKGLHDIAKRELGSAYKEYFKDAPFAHRGGIRGTTKRLNAWCARLAECISSRALPPVVVAQTLKLLDVPTHRGYEESLAVKVIAPTKVDNATDVSTTEAELTEGATSDCSSYESDFESESAYEVSDSENESTMHSTSTMNSA